MTGIIPLDDWEKSSCLSSICRPMKKSKKYHWPSMKKGRPLVEDLPFSVEKIKFYLPVVKLLEVDQAPFNA